MKIYTKSGDKGKTSLVGGKRVSKSHLRVMAYGDLDELSSYLGLIKDMSASHWPIFSDLLKSLNQTQKEIFILSSQIACAEHVTPPVTLPEDAHLRLEKEIDQMSAELPLLKHFVFPGGDVFHSHIHICRCVCRRAERQMIFLFESLKSVSPDEEITTPGMIYINRLSDWLFTASRLVLIKQNKSEDLWITSPKE